MNTFRKSFIKKEPLEKASAKAQSAMEYLMTYGWAILIISVVLAALFQLGVFNPMTFAPKAPPGSCQVFRPNGPYTTSFINLEGICSGELPQYVAKFNPSLHSGITVLAPAQLPIGSSPRTITAWVDPSGGNAWNQKVAIYGIATTANTMGLLINPFVNVYFAGEYDDWLSPLTVTNNTWNFIAVTYSGGTSVAAYANGQYATGSISSPLTTPLTNLYIGGGWYNGNYYNGLIANVQLYNTSLSANELQALYLEGIGGAPIDLQHLVGWWPLNGNANDYSGNGNNGQINNVTFVSNWYNGYIPP
jgi:hypothetical protein